MRRLAISSLAFLALLVPIRPRAGGDGPKSPTLRLAQAWPPPPARGPYAAPRGAAPPARMGAAPGLVAPPGGAPRAAPSAPAPPPGAPAARPPGHYHGPGYYPGAAVYVSPWAYPAYQGAPWYWGWGSGYGHYPVYPQPPPPPGEAAPAARVGGELALTGGPTDQRAWNDPYVRTGPGASAGLSLRVESRDLGIHAGYDGFSTSGQLGFGSPGTLDYFTAHATWSFVSGASGRLRLEAGLSVLSFPVLPASPAVAAVGPDFGLSGQLSLVGPLGVQGHARVTPSPRLAADLYAGAALRFGPVALTGGWRDLRAGGGSTAPGLRFAGPQLGLSMLF